MANTELEKTTIQQIVSLHNQVIADLKRSLESAIQIGRLLAEQKKNLKHGQFGTWIEANLPFTDRTARNYMRVYREKDRLKTETVSDLKSAYRILAAPKIKPNWVVDLFHCWASCVNCAKELNQCSWRDAFEVTYKSIKEDDPGSALTLDDLMTYHIYFFDIVSDDCIPPSKSYTHPTDINIRVDGILDAYWDDRLKKEKGEKHGRLN